MSGNILRIVAEIVTPRLLAPGSAPFFAFRAARFRVMKLMFPKALMPKLRCQARFIVFMKNFSLAILCAPDT